MKVVGAPGFGIHQGRRERGKSRRGRVSKAELSEIPGSELHGKKKDQLSFRVQRVLHNCITKPSIVPPVTDCISSIFFFLLHLSHMLCVLTVACDNKVTHEWISTATACFRPIYFKSFVKFSWKPARLDHLQEVFFRPWHVLTEHLNLFSKDLSALQRGLCLVTWKQRGGEIMDILKRSSQNLWSPLKFISQFGIYQRLLNPLNSISYKVKKYSKDKQGDKEGKGRKNMLLHAQLCSLLW